MNLRITIEDLINIRNNGEELILESHPDGIPRMSLVYYKSCYVLTRRVYLDRKKHQRIFNHIIFNDSIEDLSNEIPAIFTEAIKRIEDGKCLEWKSNTFFEANNCDERHH